MRENSTMQYDAGANTEVSTIEEAMVDITQELFDSLALITDHKVVQSPYFNLLEGTQAVEVSNPKLDTGLIELSNVEIDFDTAKPQPIASVVSVQNNLLVLFVSWLNNSNLPVTVLSCRYVQTLLENYKKNSLSADVALGEKCSLVNSRLATSCVPDDSWESNLVHKVMKSFIMGLCKFIGFTLNVSMNILYEEEDLTTRNMNLDFLMSVPAESVISQLEESAAWLKCQKSEDNDVLISKLLLQLSIITQLNKIETILQTSLPVLRSFKANELRVEYLTQGILDLEQLEDLEHDSIPAGSFSKFIQSDLDNKNIPLNLYTLEPAVAHKDLRGIFATILEFMKNSQQIQNYNQLLNYLQYDISRNIKAFNVLSRGIFQLHFIRDDKTIFGCQEVNLTTNVVTDLINNLVGENTSILQFDQIPYWGIKQEILPDVIANINQLTQELQSGIYHTLSYYGNNPCRQQQLISRSLLIWDTLQVTWESFESDLYGQFRVGDELINGELGLTVSSFIFYNKLTAMNELLLRGIDLELYKNYEMYLIYWYSAYLVKLIIELLQGRIHSIFLSKINFIEKTLPKRLKKLKAGPKKQQLKDQIQYNQDVILPRLKASLHYQTEYLIPSLQGMVELIEAVKTYLVILSSFKLIDFLKSTPNSLTSFETLFNLRLKPWSSIGVPRLPTFSQYKVSLNLKYLQTLNMDERSTKVQTLLSVIERKLESSQQIHHSILQKLAGDLEIRSQFLPSTIKHLEVWYNNLIETSMIYSNEIEKFIDLIKQKKIEEISPENYKVSTKKGQHCYFPIITIEKQ